jgi:hypothetical protein
MIVSIRSEAVSRGYSRFALTLLNEQVSENQECRKLGFRESAMPEIGLPRMAGLGNSLNKAGGRNAADPRLHYMQANYFDVVLLPTCVCENDL